jgi:SAM-dependent methyltransferase
MAKELSNILINYVHDKALTNYVSKYVSGKLVDIGCGIKPYKDIVAPFVTEHTGVDHQYTKHDMGSIDIVGTAYEIGVDECYFDSALCTSVLEHLEKPLEALKECNRILKPGGYALYSVPFIWPIHEQPRDFFRYSKYGLKYLFEEAGFEVVEIYPLTGFWITFGQLFVYNLYRYNRGFLRYLPIIPLLGLFIQFTSFLLDKVDKSEQWACMHFVVAKKTGGN